MGSAGTTAPFVEVIIVLLVVYERSGCQDIRHFENTEELNEWMKRQLVINPDTKIIDMSEES